jgi:hypothetical protein
MSSDKPRLILHVGTPKTGTSTLQHACYTSREGLASRNILYPTLGLHPNPPKHQWIVQYLLEDNLCGFEENIQNIYIEALGVNAKCVILSAEGIFNHWADFSNTAKSALAKIKEYFDVTIWCVFREPVSFAMSVYSQLVKNPPSEFVSCYSTFDSPELLIECPWFSRQLDYAGFIKEVEELFDYPLIHATRYEEGDILHQARNLLGVNAEVLQNLPNANRSLTVLGIDLMRRLNSLGLETSERHKFASKIIELDVLLSQTSSQLQASHEMRRKVLAISKKNEKFLIERFNIHWNDLSVFNEVGK